MVVYGHPWSIHTRMVLAVIEEKGAQVERVFVDVPRGGHREPAHVTRHPFAKLPVLDDEEFRLYETAPILAYLDERLPGPALRSADARERARAAQWDRVFQSYFHDHAHPLIVHRQFARIIGFPPDPAVIAAGRAGMQPALDVVDRHLRDVPWLSGGAMGLADLTWTPYVDYLLALGEHDAVVAGRRGLEAWWERVGARPPWQRVAHTGLQPYEPDASAEAIRDASRGAWTMG